MINLRIGKKLLKGFQKTLDNRDMGALLYLDNFLKELLNLHFSTWENKEKYLEKKKNIESYAEYGEILRSLDSILTNIIRRILEEKGKRLSFPFFDKLKKHYIFHKANPKYLKEFFNIFCPVFFNSIHKSSESHDIWNHYFPSDWKITKKTLENKKSYVARIWLFEFLEWSRPRIENPEKKHDFQLETITRELFPEISPILWARFLIFLFTPSYESKIKSVIERDWNFGFIGHMFFGDYPDSSEKGLKERTESLKKNTIEFMHYFNDTVIKSFSEDSLHKHKNDLGELGNTYKENSIEERHRLGLLYLITQLIEHKNKAKSS